MPFSFVTTRAQVKQHFLFFLFFTFLIISNIPFPPLKNLEDFIPGFLPRARTSMPESSEKAKPFILFDKVEAFLKAFARKVFPVSFTLNPFGALLIAILIFLALSILFISLSLSLFEDAK